jgi:pyridinium-3,5-biscarboxylic acid mononucleotide synthase
MDQKSLIELLEKVKLEQCSIEQAMSEIQHDPPSSLDFACLDQHRQSRTGVPEVIYGENKSVSQLQGIFEKMLNHPGGVVMATRIDQKKADEVCERFPSVLYYKEARMLVAREQNCCVEESENGLIAVVSAGTSDIPVAEEALVTARSLGNRVKAVYDVGVAGIHRLYARQKILHEASVLIVVAGMEGALPSVVGGLFDKPVIAVPTSVGYGTGFGGIAALLGMLNSCTPGVAVVNIDNGFGAGCMASLILRNSIS